MFSANRAELRQFFFTAWQKHLQKQPLTALEQQVVAVLIHHPEYHAYLQENKLEQEFFPEQGQANPFLHLSLHLGLHEQLSTNRPVGIAKIYHSLCEKMSQHDAEHAMMDCLAETLWHAQRDQTMPDEKVYWQRLQELTKS